MRWSGTKRKAILNIESVGETSKGCVSDQRSGEYKVFREDKLKNAEGMNDG